MSEIEIDCKANIHDDHEFCEDKQNTECCRKLTFNDGKTYCSAHEEFLEGKRVIKCDQCKAEYQKAKQKVKTDLPNADWIDNNFGVDRWVFERTHVGDAFKAGMEYQKAKLKQDKPVCIQCGYTVDNCDKCGNCGLVSD